MALKLKDGEAALQGGLSLTVIFELIYLIMFDKMHIQM